MKKILYSFITLFTLLFTACLDTEEKIALNNDGSGNYSVTMDMGKMMGMMSAFGGENKKMEKKDTVIYFKDFADTATTLSAIEKAILRTGKMGLNVDSDNGIMKIILDANFKNNTELVYLRNNLQGMVQKLKAMDKLDNNKPATGSGEESLGTPKIDPSKSNTNPFKDYYEFSATANSITYKIKDKEAALKAMETSEELMMMKQMAPMMGEMTFATKIVLPRAAKKVEGANAKLSDDKKTVTITSNFKEIMSNLDALAFSVMY